MEIRTVTPAGRHWSTRLRAADGPPLAISVTLQAPPPAPASAPPAAIGKDSPGQFVPLLAKGVAIGTVYNRGTWLLTQVNSATPEQVAGTLRQFHLVNDPGMAHAQGKQLVDFAQSKGASSLMIGAVAGTCMVVAVDAVRPGWPAWVKLAIGAVTAAVVAGLLYFGLKDKPAEPPAPRPIAAPR